MVQIDVAIPQTFLDGRPNLALVRRFCERAEDLGIPRLWVEEQTSGAMPILAPIELLSYVSAFTSSARLGVAVLLAGLGSPVHFARSLNTLDHLSGGRLDIGLGAGESVEYTRYGLDVGSRGRRFDETVRIMKRLWTEKLVTFDGEVHVVREAGLRPATVQQPHPPLYFGGRVPAARRRAVELGDGFIGAGATSTRDYAEHVKHIRTQLEAAGRDVGRFPIGKRVYLQIDADRERALGHLKAWFRRFYGDYVQPEEVAVWGSVEECADRLREVIAAGAGFLLLNPVAEEMQQLELIAGPVREALGAQRGV